MARITSKVGYAAPDRYGRIDPTRHRLTVTMTVDVRAGVCSVPGPALHDRYVPCLVDVVCGSRDRRAVGRRAVMALLAAIVGCQQRCIVDVLGMAARVHLVGRSCVVVVAGFAVAYRCRPDHRLVCRCRFTCAVAIYVGAGACATVPVVARCCIAVVRGSYRNVLHPVDVIVFVGDGRAVTRRRCVTGATGCIRHDRAVIDMRSMCA